MQQHMCPLHLSSQGRAFTLAPQDGGFQPRALGGVSCSLVPWEMLGCRTSRGAGGSGCVAAGSCLPPPPSRALTVAVDDSQGCVPCATWPCPSRNKAPYLFTHGAQAVSQQPPPPSPPSAPGSRGCAGVGISLRASPWLCSQGATVGSVSVVSLQQSCASQRSLGGCCWDTARSQAAPPACATSPSGFPLQ